MLGQLFLAICWGGSTCLSQSPVLSSRPAVLCCAAAEVRSLLASLGGRGSEEGALGVSLGRVWGDMLRQERALQPDSGQAQGQAQAQAQEQAQGQGLEQGLQQGQRQAQGQGQGQAQGQGQELEQGQGQRQGPVQDLRLWGAGAAMLRPNTPSGPGAGLEGALVALPGVPQTGAGSSVVDVLAADNARHASELGLSGGGLW